MRDILVRLGTDAGQLTIAELIQEREAAASEIERLRSNQDRADATTNLPRRMREASALAAKVAPRGCEPLQLGELVCLLKQLVLCGLRVCGHTRLKSNSLGLHQDSFAEGRGIVL